MGVVRPQSGRTISVPIGRIRLMNPDHPSRFLAPCDAQRHVRYRRPRRHKRIVCRVRQQPHNANADPEAQHRRENSCLRQMSSRVVIRASRSCQADEPKNEARSQWKGDPLAGVCRARWFGDHAHEEPDQRAQTHKGPEPACHPRRAARTPGRALGPEGRCASGLRGEGGPPGLGRALPSHLLLHF
jgi:hypothetical protein